MPTFRLPEGLLWNSSLLCFEFVDILSGSIYRYKTSPYSLELVKVFDSTIGWIFPTNCSHQYICGLQNKIVLWDAKIDVSTDLLIIDLKEGQRLNDALLVDDSQIWFGVMSSNISEGVQDGALYSLSSIGLIKQDTCYLIPNGPLLTIDRLFMLHSDSEKGLLYRYPYKDGEIDAERREVVLDVSNLGASPDGMCLDAAGSVYVSMWGIGQVWKLDLQFNIERKFSIPHKYITNVVLGGVDLDDLLVSYAEDRELGLSGGLFHIENHNAKGVEPSKWYNL